MRSDAGPWHSRELLSAYISGYADGEGCFTVSISPRAKLLAGWEVRPSFSVSQNGDRAEVLQAMQAYFQCGGIRPDRSDKTLKWETRNTSARGSPRVCDSSLSTFSAYLGQEARLRTLRSRLSITGGGSSSDESRPHRDRRARSRNESERETTIRRGSDSRAAAPR
jgi:hypothetical protein